MLAAGARCAGPGARCAGGAGQGLALVVWDAYRPQRASDHFLLWSQEPEIGEAAARLRGRFHPGIDRRDLFARGFLSERSSHSKGAAVDLGLLDASGGLLDFGAPFDFFDAISATGSADVSPRPAPTGPCCAR